MASTACFVQQGLSVHTCTFDPDMALNAVYTESSEEFLQCNTAGFYINIHTLCMMCIIVYIACIPVSLCILNCLDRFHPAQVCCTPASCPPSVVKVLQVPTPLPFRHAAETTGEPYQPPTTKFWMLWGEILWRWQNKRRENNHGHIWVCLKMGSKPPMK